MPRERRTRRSVLKAIGGLGAMGLSGCLGRSPRTDTTETLDGTPSAGSTPGNELRSSPETPDGTPPKPCPPAFAPDPEVRCRERSGVRMTASTADLSMPRDEVTITLHNGSDTTLSGDVMRFRLYHRREGRWYAVGLRSQPGIINPVEIQPGAEHAWSIRLDTEALAPVYPPREGRPLRDFVFRLGPGPYWFGFDIDGPDGRHMYAARFDVAGEGLPLRPSEQVIRTSTFRTDEMLTVRRPGDSRPREVALDMERLSSIPSHANHLTTFELYNPGFWMTRHEDDDPIHTPNGTPLADRDEHAYVDTRLVKLFRDALALYEGSASRIRVETRASVVPPLGLSDSLAVVYRGTAWRVTSRNGWE